MAKPAFDLADSIFDTEDGVVAVDREQRIILWNEGAEALIGFTAEEVLGRHCHEVFGGRDESGRIVCQAGCADLTRALRRERVRTRDLLVRTKAGQEVWINISTLRLLSPRQDLSVLVHLFRDVSRQKAVERLVKRIHSNMERLSLSSTADPSSTSPSLSPPVDLTRREREVLRLLASGASTATIAKKLFVSPATVRNHIKHLLAKLGVHSRLEAVALALRNGLL